MSIRAYIAHIDSFAKKQSFTYGDASRLDSAVVTLTILCSCCRVGFGWSESRLPIHIYIYALMHKYYTTHIRLYRTSKKNIFRHKLTLF